MADSSSSSSSPASYIHLVQHLIEKCLIFHMTKEECMEALSKHANINPVITSTGMILIFSLHQTPCTHATSLQSCICFTELVLFNSSSLNPKEFYLKTLDITN